MFEEFQIELIIRFTKIGAVNLFSSKTSSSRIEHPPALCLRHAMSSPTRTCVGLGLCLFVGLLPPSLSAQSRLSSSQMRSEVSRLSSNDQHQDLRLYNLEKDVDYLQRKTGYQPRGPSPISAKAPVQTLPTSTNYTVRPGDTVWRIAMNHRVSPGEIMQLNGLKSDSVNVGQTLKIPAKGAVQSTAPQTITRTSKPTSSSPSKPAATSGRTHTIQKGETFSQIAQQLGVSQSALKQANPQVNPDVIIVGAKLNVPSSAKAPTTSPAPASPPAESAIATPTGSLRHTVRPGETLSSIATAHGVSATAIQRSNTLSNPDRLSIGQVITIPAGGVATVALAPTTPKPAPTPTYPATPSKSTPTPASTSTTSPGPAPQSNPRGVLSYRVHSTDTLESIASTFGTTPEKIRELNRKPAGSKVVPDEEILVPAMGAVSL